MRLWPISRALIPKQFVVSNAEQYFLAADQLEELHQEHNKFLLEPVGRNTVLSIALACFALDADEVILVSPSDHLIKNEEAYAKALQEAKNLALQGNLVTFGIRPTFAEIEFGYIEADGNNVKAFHEKPDAQTAQKYYVVNEIIKKKDNNG